MRPPEKKVKGYKNIPSLDAITARLAKARSLSIDGSVRPPEAEMIEDPKTPGAVMKAPEHPLQFTWCVSMLRSEATFHILVIFTGQSTTTLKPRFPMYPPKAPQRRMFFFLLFPSPRIMKRG